MSEQDNNAPQGAGSGETPKTVKRRVPMFKDPLVRTMAWVVGGLVILYLVTIVSALVLGVLGNTTPRTRVERDERIFEKAITENPQDIVYWAKYIDSLMETKQWTAAQDAIDRAIEVVDQKQSQEISTAQVQLYIATNRNKEAIEEANAVRASLKQYYDEALKDDNSDEAKGADIHENYWNLLLIKAEAYVALKDVDKALEALDEYLAEKPAAADVLIRRGDLRAEQGDKEGAEKDFRAALVFIPNDAAALEGLKKIGVEE